MSMWVYTSVRDKFSLNDQGLITRFPEASVASRRSPRQHVLSLPLPRPQRPAGSLTVPFLWGMDHLQCVYETVLNSRAAAEVTVELRRHFSSVLTREIDKI